MKVAVVGASGYVGLELLRILLRHGAFELAAVTSEQQAGRAVGDSFPSLRGRLDLRFEPADAAALAGRVELAFTALPHAASAGMVAALRRAGVRVVDLSADFRLRDPAVYRATYGDHAAPELLDSAVYGLPEVYREALRGAELVAAPGCYPTGVLLPWLPFLREGLVEPVAWIDAKSGVSGAGRRPEVDYLFAELDGNCRAYKVGAAHRHVPEMEQEASRAAGLPAQVTFVPHMLPAVRGIVTTVFARPRAPLSASRAREVLQAAWGDETFVRVLPEGETPSLSAVRGSNFCDVAAFADERTGALLLLSSLDNLVKGAAGQAVQCANLACGLPEDTGLLEAPLVP
jgi:N-acetyl-gamma-glutamyl-phosphate reductase